MKTIKIPLTILLILICFNSAGFNLFKRDFRTRIIYTGTNEFARKTANLLINSGVKNIDSISMFLASAITETGWGRSRACKRNNNLFGIRLKNGSYRKYKYAIDCVKHRLNFKNGFEKMSETPNYEEYIYKFSKILKKDIKYIIVY